MGFWDSLSVFKEGAKGLLNYAWVAWILVPIAAIIFIVVMWKIIANKKRQWTHTLVVRRVLQNNLVSKPTTIRMRRFPLIKRAEVFELETPLLGGLLMPELDSYSGPNEYSVVLDNNNRIYTNKGEFFCPDKSSVNVSAKHSEIDIARADLRADFQEVHKVNKRIEWAQIAKYAMFGLLIIAVMVISIKGLDQWGENNKANAERARAEAQSWDVIEQVMEGLESNVNANILLADALKDLYDTNNLQPIIREKTNETI